MVEHILVSFAIVVALWTLETYIYTYFAMKKIRIYFESEKTYKATENYAILRSVAKAKLFC